MDKNKPTMSHESGHQMLLT